MTITIPLKNSPKGFTNPIPRILSAQNKRLKRNLRGSGDTSRENVVEPRTEQQRILQRLGQDIGQRVVFFDNPNKDFHGAHVGNTTFLNVNSEFALPQVFWHETAHWLKLNNPELYRRLLKAANITDAQREAYLEETQRTDLKTDAEIDEEIIADRLEDVMKRAGFLRDIGRKDQNLIERLIAWLQDMMSKFREYFQNPQGKLTRLQAQRMANEFGRMAKDIVNQRGEKIFRYNAKTHTTELATGESLENLYAVAQREANESAQAAQTKKALVELARTAWNDKDFNGKVSFTPSKKFRDKAQEIFGHDVETVFITGSDVRHIKNHHGTNEKNRGQIDMTPEDIADIYDAVNDFDTAEQGDTDKKGHKAIVVTRSLNDTQSYVVTAERGTKKAKIKTALQRKKAQVLDVTSPERNVRNDPALSSAENIPQAEYKHNAVLVKQFGGRIVNGKPVFDNARDEADYQRYVEAERRGEVKLSFAGEKALTASTSRLAAANLMDRRGKSRDEIFKATGWIKGKDDQWRFEIPDDLGKVEFAKLKRDGTATLGEIYDNPKLYAAYPFLRDLPVHTKKLTNAFGEAHYPTDKIINGKPRFIGNIDIDSRHLKTDGAKGTLIHEIQHIVQMHENFAAGGDPQFARDLLRARGENPDGLSDEDAWALLGGEQEAEEVRERAVANDVRSELERSQKEYAAALKTFNEVKAAQSPAVQKLLTRYKAAQRNDDDTLADKLLDKMPPELVEAIENLDDASNDLGYWEDNFAGRLGTPRIHSDNAIITQAGEGQSMSRPAPPIDNQQRFDDNETHIQNEILSRFQDDNLMSQIDDGMTIAEVREKILRTENVAVAQALAIYDRRVNANRVDKTRVAEARDALKKVIANADEFRRSFVNPESLRGLQTALRSQNKGRKGSSLAETLQRALDEGRTGNSNERGRGVIQIPGEYRRTYERPIVKELLEEIRNEREHSEKQGAFSLGKTKFAGNDELARHFRNATKLKPDELNGRERKWIELGKTLGVEVVWMEAHTDLKGAVDDGKIYLNRRTSEDTVKTFWHEQFHLLEAANPELHRELMTYFTDKDAFTKAQLDAYREETNRRDLTDEQAIDEILCDNFAQVQKRVKLIREMSEDNPSLTGRFVAWLKYLADKVASLFRNTEGGMTTAQRDAFIKGVNELTSSFNMDSSQTQTGLLFAKQQTIATDEEYTQAVNDYRNANDNAVPEQTVAYKVRTTAPPKKTIKVYKVFTVANDGSPTALFVGGTKKLPQGVWLDAQDAYHFTSTSGSSTRGFIPSVSGFLSPLAAPGKWRGRAFGLIHISSLRLMRQTSGLFITVTLRRWL